MRWDWDDALTELAKDEFVRKIEIRCPQLTAEECEEYGLDSDIHVRGGWQVKLEFAGHPRGRDSVVLGVEDGSSKTAILSCKGETLREAALHFLRVLSATKGWERYCPHDQ